MVPVHPFQKLSLSLRYNPSAKTAACLRACAAVRRLFILFSACASAALLPIPTEYSSYSRSIQVVQLIVQVFNNFRDTRAFENRY